MLGNPDFELPQHREGSIDGWGIIRRPGVSVALDDRDAQSGRRSARIARAPAHVWYGKERAMGQGRRAGLRLAACAPWAVIATLRPIETTSARRASMNDRYQGKLTIEIKYCVV